MKPVVVLSDSPDTFVQKSIDDLVALAPRAVRRERHWPQGNVDVIIAGSIDRYTERIKPPPGLARLSRHPQGYLLCPRKWSGQNVLMVAGSDDHGLAYGLKECACQLSLDPAVARIKETFSYPRFRKRGVYAHQHWSYNHPYALRSWSFSDWKNYLDILAVMKVNLFLIWPMACLLPMPISRRDRRYLEGYERIVDYARRYCGMEVLLGETPNTLADRTTRLPPVARRKYFECVRPIDPSSREFDTKIIRNRELLYRLTSGADGYSIIDSDDGGYPGSTADDFVNILVKNRRAIDRASPHGREKTLYYWLWLGWGELQTNPHRIRTRPDAWQATIAGMRRGLPEPWGLFACWKEHLDLVRREKLLHKTIYFPYGAVEGEPNGPMTEMRLEDIDAAIDLVKPYGDDLRGIQCNVQTPFVQIPNLFHFHRRLWEDGHETAPQMVLRQCAQLLSPRHAGALFDGWDALRSNNVGRLQYAYGRLKHAPVGRLSGIMGKCLENCGGDVIGDLSDSLAVHLAEQKLINVLTHYTDRKNRQLSRFLIEYMEANIAVAHKTGFIENNFYSWKSLERIRERIEALAFRRVMAVFNSVQALFCRGRDRKMKEMAIEFIRSRLKIFKYW